MTPRPPPSPRRIRPLAPPCPDADLRRHLLDLRTRGRKAMGLFLTNGFPDPAATGPILDASWRAAPTSSS